MKNLLKNIGNLFRADRSRSLEQLQWQRYLLHTGIPATAKVLDMIQEKSEMQEYVLIRIWVMMKASGNISYQHIQTLVSKKDIPSVGQIINIRYCPDNITNVIIV